MLFIALTVVVFSQKGKPAVSDVKYWDNRCEGNFLLSYLFVLIAEFSNCHN